MLCFPSSCVMERGWKPNVELTPACPRCGSSNTKFCYYNNYSLTQPRYFCKGCRRYWTKGGSLRNVPMGGGCRKSRRGKLVRVSSDGVSSRGLATLGQDRSQLFESTSSMPGPDGPNIDLAVVYANFLNPKPQPEANQLEVSLLPSRVGPSFEFCVHNKHLDLTSHLPHESGLIEYGTYSKQLSYTHISDGNAIHSCGHDSIQNHQLVAPQFSCMNHTSNYVLPPLPGEELIVSEGMVWPSADVMLHRQMLHVTHSSGVELEPQIPNPLNGNESSLNMPNFENIFKP